MKNLQTIKKKIGSIWNYTELEMSDFYKAGLQKHINEISNIVNDVLGDLEEVNTCTVCQSNICDTCLDDMAKQFND